MKDFESVSEGIGSGGVIPMPTLGYMYEMVDAPVWPSAVAPSACADERKFSCEERQFT